MSAASDRRTSACARRVAGGLVVGMGLVLGAAWLPPFLPEAWRAALMAAFGSVCHQLPARSPHVGEVPIAICDRCTGIYSGLLLGSLVMAGWRRLGGRALNQGRFVLLGALVPLGIDWIAPVLGVWANTPISRGLTGGLFGLAAGVFVLDRLLRSSARAETSLSVQDGNA